MLRIQKIDEWVKGLEEGLLQNQRPHLPTVEWLSFGSMACGKSHVIATALLIHAGNHVGDWIYVWDYYPGPESRGRLIDRIVSMVGDTAPFGIEVNMSHRSFRLVRKEEANENPGN